MHRVMWVLMLAVAWLALSAGTAWAQGPAEPAPAAAEPAPSPPATARVIGTYTVGPGDVLQVQVYGEDGLTGAFPVNDQGRLDFPLIGPQQVEGLSADEVAVQLRTRLQDGFIRDAVVTVWIEQFGSQPVQILGAVDKPGTYYVRGPTTLMQVLSEAGGVGRGGGHEVRLTRGGSDGDTEVFTYDRLLRDGGASVQVRGGDVVYVPESLVYVSGKVAQPGPVSFRDDLTVTQCIAEAGGAAPAANLGRVYVLRGDERIRVNVRRILRGKSPDVPVRSGDQVFVQESVL